MIDEHDQKGQQLQRARKGRRLAYFALSTFLILVLLVLILSPAANRADVLLRFLAIVASWPVVAGVVLIALFTSFRPEISTYMKFAKVKYGEFEVSAEQPQTPKAVLGAVAIEANAVGSGGSAPVDEQDRVTPVAPDHSEIKAWLAAELEKRELEATSWKNVFLDQFLVEGAKGALVWFHNFTAVPESFYHAKLETFIPDPQKRSRILQTLLELALVCRSGDLLSITDGGTKYLEHIYSSAAAAGRPVRHPFVSREDVQQYGRRNIHGDNGGAKDDVCRHTDIKVGSPPMPRRRET
jgi:uncharacterized integral membrane protein